MFRIRPIVQCHTRFSCPRTFRAIAFAYFSFRVRCVEFVSWSRSCCWLGRVRVQFVCFPHRFHQILAVVTNFAHTVPVLSSNSEPILKTGLVFTYELGFWRSIYQNQSEKNFRSIHPSTVGVRNFYFGQKLVTRCSFRGHRVFVDFEHIFGKFHRPRLSLVYAHIFCGYLFYAPK